MKAVTLFCTMMLGGCGLLGGVGLTSPAPQGQLVPPEALAPLMPPPAGRSLWAELGQDAGQARPVRQEGPRYFWRMDEGVVFVTEGARVVATAGLPTLLLASTPIGDDPLRRGAPLGPGPLRLAHSFDFAGAEGRPEQMRFGQVVQCRIEPEEPDIGGVIERVEICEGAAFFTNRFWFRAADRVLIRSEQWIGRDVPPLRLEVAVEGS
ncbi:MAG: YjbF family lipoprotein [Roseomonas sp.]|nr:YjbF family lipoprotein [Roseomonas sp.]MCA3327785.1 YjbF family lipoprotein [Roseomonas sp.]MCA3329667.1 YjbF family lipoprotein [Roseomonas sp.]MCA3334476.1 YjbF family lipoprotein [Roseomonas sp.]MCA3348255.1 YjbF family lipoprotein [Roseomonas sp.]